jgi:16S rRNA (guanine527-N7)-methyltransferase
LESTHIAELLQSYIVGLSLPPIIYDQLGAYLQLLLRWNAKTNLTAIRDPEQIVTRHFGESLFAAGVLFGTGSAAAPSDNRQLTTGNSPTTLADLGSGAGFPGLPIKLAFPTLHVTLIESQNKKATFLKEVIRALRLDGIEVYSGRAEQWGKQADVVTLRAVEKFESALAVAAGLVANAGRLCLLIAAGQGDAMTSLGEFHIEVEREMPNRPETVVLVGSRP